MSHLNLSFSFYKDIVICIARQQGGCRADYIYQMISVRSLKMAINSHLLLAISFFGFNQLHWLPLSACIEFKIRVLVLKSKLVVAPKYHRYHICSSLSATPHRPQRSLDWPVLSVPWVGTTMAQTRSFATIGPSIWNALPSPHRLALLSWSLSA